MASRRSIPASLLAGFLLATLLTPLGGAQEAPSCADAVAVRTDRASYPPGTEVRITLTNLLTTGDVTLNDGRIDLWADASTAHTLSFDRTVLGPGEALVVPWTASANRSMVAAGDYTGLVAVAVEVEGRFGSSSCFLRLNQGDGFVLEAPPGAGATPPAPGEDGPDDGDGARLLVRTDPAEVAAGEGVRLTVTNLGAASLFEDGCGVRFVVRDPAGAPVFDSTPGQRACSAEVLELASGATRTRAWDVRDGARLALPPGTYRLDAAFGGAAGTGWFRVRAPDEPTPEPGSVSLRLVVREPRMPAGGVVSALLTNTGQADAPEGLLRFEVRDEAGRLRHAEDRAVALPAGGSMELAWNTRAAPVAPAGPGTYALHASLSGTSAESSVALVDASGGAPGTGHGSGDGAGGAGPDGGLPGGSPGFPGTGGPGAVTGGGFQGTWVRFRVAPSERAVTDVTVLGEPAVAHLEVPGAGTLASDLASLPGVARLRAGTSLLTVHDAPAATLRLEVPGGASTTLALAPGVTARAAPGGLLLQGERVVGTLLLHGDAEARPVPAATPGSGAALALSWPDTDRTAGTGGFTLRLWTPPVGEDAAAWRSRWSEAMLGAPAQADPAEGASPQEATPAAMQVAMGRALTRGLVGAEAFLAGADAEGVEVQVVPYTDAPLHLQVSRPAPALLRMVVDVASHEGRTLVFHLDPALAAALGAEVEVRYDGQPIPQAPGALADVLDPHDDGLAAEWLVVRDPQRGDEGEATLLVSVPHFSVHTLEVAAASLAEVLPSLAPHGAAAGGALVALAALLLVRRGRQAGP